MRKHISEWKSHGIIFKNILVRMTVGRLFWCLDRSEQKSLEEKSDALENIFGDYRRIRYSIWKPNENFWKLKISMRERDTVLLANEMFRFASSRLYCLTFLLLHQWTWNRCFTYLCRKSRFSGYSQWKCEFINKNKEIYIDVFFFFLFSFNFVSNFPFHLRFFF